jgi:hypothetical protein
MTVHWFSFLFRGNGEIAGMLAAITTAPSLPNRAETALMRR